MEPNFGGEELGISIDWVCACVAGGPAVGDIHSRFSTATMVPSTPPTTLRSKKLKFF